MISAAEWTSRDAFGLEIPVNVAWTKLAGPQFVYSGIGARLDVRYVKDGRMVDLAYLRDLQASADGTSSTPPQLIRVAGHPGICTVTRHQQATIVAYTIGGQPSVDGSDVTFPEWRIVYVLEDVCLESVAPILELMNGEPLGSIVAAHPQTAEGHLSFGPVMVPGPWSVLLDDGPHALPPIESAVREVDVGGGWLVFVSEFSSGAVQSKCVFRPHWFGDLSRVDAAAIRRAGAHTGSRLRGAIEVSMRRTVFGPEMAVYYREGMVVRGSEGLRVGLVWQDILGYQWELYYEVDVAHGRWIESLVDMVSVG